MQDDAPQIEVAGEDVTALNQQLVNRLRLLQYEKQYIQKGFKAVNSASFTFPTNPSEQFNNFKNLVKWLFQINDISASDFSKYDDPMTISTTILNQCKKLSIPCDFPPLLLKSGSGQKTVYVLNQLATKAMKRKNFNFKKPKYEDIKQLEQEKPDNTDQKIDDGDEMLDQVQMGEQDQMEEKQMGAGAADEDKQIIVSVVSENDWKLECERVANKLKVQFKQDAKEWRSHTDGLKSSNTLIKKNFPNSRVLLEKMNDELTRTLDRISRFESQINNNMSDIGEQYKSQSEELKKLSTHYNNLNNSIKEMSENYRNVGEKLDQFLAKTTEHTGQMTDTSPVVKIKDAYKSMLAEVKSMDVRMGVLSHTILQYKSKERSGDMKAKNVIDLEDLEQF